MSAVNVFSSPMEIVSTFPEPVKNPRPPKLIINTGYPPPPLELKEQEELNKVQVVAAMAMTNHQSVSIEMSAKVSHHKNEILKQYHVEGGFLISNKGKINSNLSIKMLEKIITTALSILTTEDQKLIICAKRKYIGKLSKDNLTLFKLGQKIGGGSVSVVFSATSIHTGNVVAFKRLRKSILASNQKNMRIQQMFLEHSKIKKLNPHNAIWGMISKPYEFVGIPVENIYGYFCEKYEEEYFTYLERSFIFQDNVALRSTISLDVQLIEIHQLLSVLKYLSDNNIVHGDIKLENILKNVDGDGFPFIHLADLGNSGSSPEEVADFLTLTYVPEKELHRTTVYRWNGQNKDFMTAKKAMDVFAMGCVLYAIFRCASPYYISEDSLHPILERYSWQPISSDLAPSQINDIIQAMIDPTPSKRPSGAVAFEIFNQFLQQKHPNVLEKINNKMKSLTCTYDR